MKSTILYGATVRYINKYTYIRHVIHIWQDVMLMTKPTIGSAWGFFGVAMFCPCLFCPSDNFEHCLALPTCWHTLGRARFYWYLLCDPRRCDYSRKVCASRWLSHCHLDKTNRDTKLQHRFEKMFQSNHWAISIV